MAFTDLVEVLICLRKFAHVLEVSNSFDLCVRAFAKSVINSLVGTGILTSSDVGSCLLIAIKSSIDKA